MKKIIKEIISIIFSLFIILTITWLCTNFIAQRTIVYGESMEPSLNHGDNLIVDKISYKFKDPERFDIVIFPVEDGTETNYVKRIIGLPGETVYIDSEGDIYINNQLLIEFYGKEIINDAGRASEEITLGNDEYFVLGDNRNNSIDSRMEIVGNVKKENIIGRAWIRIFPLEKIKVLSK